MADELDLETGEPEIADAVSSREKRRQSRQTKSSGADSGSSAATKREENDLAARISNAFTRIADQLASRGDDELATAISEENGPMTTGLMSLTRTVPFLRSPLLVIIGVLEPVLAFGRVGRILFGRFLARRQAQYEEAVAEGEVVSDATVVG